MYGKEGCLFHFFEKFISFCNFDFHYCIMYPRCCCVCYILVSVPVQSMENYNLERPDIYNNRLRVMDRVDAFIINPEGTIH